MMMLGRELQLPLQAVVPRPKEDHPEDVGDFVQGVHEKMEQAHEAASFKEGQAVWYHNSSLKHGRYKKFTSPWKGPYIVTQAIDDIKYRIQLNPSTKPIVCHADTHDLRMM